MARLLASAGLMGRRSRAKVIRVDINEEEKSAKVKETTESKEEVTRRYDSKAVEISILDVEHVIKQLEVLPPLGNSIRDYIIINDTLYIAPENLEKPDTESRVKLPDGSFVTAHTDETTFITRSI